MVVELPRNLLLSALSREDYALLRPHLAEVRLEQKTILQFPGEPISHVYFPLSGMISILATFTTGEAIEIAAIGREGAVGARIGRRPEVAFAQAIEQLPGAALKIELSKFQDAARKSFAITNVAMLAGEVMVINLQQSAACNALHSLEQRMARWLLHTLDRFDGDELPLSQVFLSEMLGVRRTTVTLAAQTLQQAGVINYRRGKIQIIDRPRLEIMSCDCYRAIKLNIAEVAAGAESLSTTR